MSLPKPKTDVELDAQDWLDIRRTEITLRHRMAARREKNEVLEEARAALQAGRVLRPELEAGDEES